MGQPRPGGEAAQAGEAGGSFGEVSSRALYSCCPPPSRAMVAALARFIHRGHITEVVNMTLWNLDLAELPYAASLADVTVTGEVNIARVSGHIAPVLSRIRCSCLSLDHMRLSAGDTRALVTAMMTSVDMVELGLGPAVGSSSRGGPGAGLGHLPPVRWPGALRHCVVSLGSQGEARGQVGLVGHGHGCG